MESSQKIVKALCVWFFMEEGYKVKILHVGHVTHDVKRFMIEKPAEYMFVPGQACDVAIDKDGWREKQRPFTF
ncbi:MAG: flavodoxin reductase family protein, partial [bacterium]